MRWKPDFRRMSPHAQALGWGLLGVGAYAPFSLWPLGIVCWAGLYLLLRQPGTLRRALGIGFAFGLGQFLGGVSWVYVSMHDVGGMPAARNDLAGRPKPEKKPKERKAYVDPNEGLGRPAIFRRFQ